MRSPMHGRRNLLVLGAILVGLVLLALLLRPGLEVTLQVDSDVVTSAEPYRLDDRRDSLVVFGQSDVVLSAASRVDGDAAVVNLSGAPVQIDGYIGGDLTVIGGSIVLGAQARVDGAASLIGSTVDLQGQVNGDLVVSADALTVGPAAQLAGTVGVCGVMPDALFDERAESARTPLGKCPEQFSASPSISSAVFLLGGTLLFAGLSALVVIAVPRQIGQMEQAIRRQPRMLALLGLAVLALVAGIGGGIGLLSWFGPALLLALAPVALILLLVVGALAAVGAAACCLIVGDWLLRRVRVQTPPVVAALVGSLVIGIGANLLLLTPILGLAAAVGLIAVLSIGLGAALHTRFGTRLQANRYFVQG